MRKSTAAFFIFALLAAVSAFATSIAPPRLETISLTIEEAVRLGFAIEGKHDKPKSTITIKAPASINGRKYSSLTVYLYNNKEPVTDFKVEGLSLDPVNRVPLRLQAPLLTHWLSVNGKYVNSIEVGVFYENYLYLFSFSVNGL